jgi:3-deoxy-D-manno-octulosonic-acid transferase
VKFRAFVAPLFSQLDAVTIPFEADLGRWKAIGVAEEKIHLLGSVKFDSTSAAGALEAKEKELRQWLDETGFPSGARILLGGSTHNSEELLLAKTTRDLQTDFPDLATVIIPRHAERGAAIAGQLIDAGFDPILRAESTTLLDDRPDSVQSSTKEGRVSENRVWIANTTGELRAWYQLVELVVIGKSFGGEGGQNPVEPILAGKPVIVGPNMQNFSDVVADLLRVEGLVQAENAEVLPELVRELLLDSERRKAMASSGIEAMAQHEGSADRNAALVLAQIRTRK